ncbi:MAG: AsmA family protein [Gammaproteobacteria bacterium]|nr:AsmA family protein [Gammaproteobacteria bacterium]
MTRIIKRTAAVVSGVLVLALAVTIAVAWLFDADAYKPQIEARVQKEIGRALSIKGKLSLSLFPGLGLDVGRTVMRNPPEFNGGAFAEFESMSIRVKLLPLLRGNVEVDRLVIDGLSVHLVHSAAGQHNYDDLLARGKTPGGTQPAALALGGLTLKDASLSYEDRQTGKTLRITDLQLRAGAFSAPGLVPIAAGFTFKNSSFDAEGHASIDTELFIDPSSQSIGVRPFAMSVGLRGSGVPNGQLELEVEASARYDLGTRSLSLSDFEIASKTPEVGAAPVHLSIPHAAVDLAAQTAFLQSFTVTALGLKVDGDLAARALGSEPMITGHLRLKNSSLRDLLARLGRPLPDANLASLPDDARLQADVSGDLHGVSLETIDASVGGVQITGRIALGFASELPLSVTLGMDVPAKVPGDSFYMALQGSGRASLATSVYQVDEFALTLGPMTARGAITLNTSADKLSYTAALELPEFDARALLEHLGQPVPETRDPRALTRVRAKAAISGSAERMVVDPLTLGLDDTRLEGTLSVSEMFSANRSVTFELDGDALDTGRYLPPESRGQSTAAASAGSTAALRVDAWRTLPLNGRIRFRALVVGDTTLNNVELVARSKNDPQEPRSESVPQMLQPGEHTASATQTVPAP